MTLPSDAQERKDTPIYSGVLRYFPRAIAYVAMVSKAGNDQHHPGTPLHWDKSKSTDEGDALVRHQMEAGLFDEDGIRHSGKVAWRGLAQLERELEAAENPEYLPDAYTAARQDGETWHGHHVIKKSTLDTLADRYGPAPSSSPAGYYGSVNDDAGYANEVEGP